MVMLLHELAPNVLQSKGGGVLEVGDVGVGLCEVGVPFVEAGAGAEAGVVDAFTGFGAGPE